MCVCMCVCVCVCAREQPPMALAGLESGKYSTCAVVGSAGHLLHGEHGEHIDAHDVVVRFNTVPVGGKLAKNVGTRTTMRFLNPRRALELCKVRGNSPPSDPLQTPYRPPTDPLKALVRGHRCACSTRGAC